MVGSDVKIEASVAVTVVPGGVVSVADNAEPAMGAEMRSAEERIAAKAFLYAVMMCPLL